MNVVILSGRLTKKPELRSTASGTNVCNYSLAVDNNKIDENGKRCVDFIECVCFGKQAENLAKYQDKGNVIEVKGRLQTDRYTNNEGKNVSKTFIYSETINYISQAKTNAYEAKNDEKKVYEDPYASMGNKVSSELPF